MRRPTTRTTAAGARTARMLRASRQPGARPERPPSRALPVALVLASLTLITVDRATGEGSPLEPARTGAATVLGPVQQGLSAAGRPLGAVGGFFTTVEGLREDNVRLQERNDTLRAQLAVTEAARTRLAEYDALDEVTRRAGVKTVEARVIAVGAAQSFNRTVTIDSGTRQGVGPDMTVLDSDGLVGRVLRAGVTTATVLLVVDADSVVGGRVGSSAELGFLRGDGELSGDGSLTMTTLDSTARPRTGDTVVTWGSRRGVPYIAGAPIGTVVSAQATARDTSSTVSVQPFVDFSALDVVSVVTKAPQQEWRVAPRAGRVGSSSAGGG